MPHADHCFIVCTTQTLAQSEENELVRSTVLDLLEVLPPEPVARKVILEPAAGDEDGADTDAPAHQ